MKKQHFTITFILAIMAMLAVGCQKEEAATVTLGAKIQKPISNGSKVYIDDHTPCWHNGDLVRINNVNYPIIGALGVSARIENVVASNGYRAIFPANICGNIYNSPRISVTLPSSQTYRLVGGRQRVDVPMGAYITSGSTLQFHNLCSVVRVTISNSLNTDISLRSITLTAETAGLSGDGTAYVYGESTDYIDMANSNFANHDVGLVFTDNCPATVDALGTRTFDIVVPAFTTDDVTIRVITTDGRYFELTKEDVSLDNNTITTVTVNVTGLNPLSVAKLVDGSTFNSAIPSINVYLMRIFFKYNSTVPSGVTTTTLSTSDSPVPIYGYQDGYDWIICTSASIMDANPDCSGMFANLNSSTSRTVHSIDFGSGFNTSNVTNMESMFSRCFNLESLDLSLFNTSNVTKMQFMFFQCTSLTSLDLSNFNTSNVTNMNCMFAHSNRLTSIDFSSFNTTSVISMGQMFQNCSSLTSLDLSNFYTPNCSSINQMFASCSSLASLNLSNLNTSNVTMMFGLFWNCSSLTSLDISHFDMSNVTNKNNMCNGLSTTSGECTITCPLSVENAIKETNPNYDPNDEANYPYYITMLPTSGVDFTWVRPSSSK